MSNNQLITREKEAKDLLKGKIKQIELLTGDTKKASKFGSALVQLSQNKNLIDCKVESVLDVGFQIVQAGLNPNPLFGQAYVVPFKVKNNFTVAQLQVGYKGYMQLGYRAGWRFKAVPVYKCDNFDIDFGGFEDVITLKPNYEDRNEDDGNWVFKNLIGVIVYAKDKHDYISTEFVSFKKLEQLRTKSQNQVKGKLQHIWLTWAEEMYKAKALKYVITRLPIEDEIQEVIQEEDKVFNIEAQTLPDNQNNSTPVNEAPTDLNALNAPTQPNVQPNNNAAIDIEIPEQQTKTESQQMVEELVKRGATEEQAQNWCMGKESVLKTYLNDPASIDVALEEAVGF